MPPAKFRAGSTTCFHIDGRHRYEDVEHDFAGWRPKLSDRAIVLFHDDEEVREREFGVWRLWREVSSQHPSFAFAHGHGLGVLGVGAALGDAVRLLFEAGEPAQKAIRQAYARLGYGVRIQFERYWLAEEVKKRDRLLTEAHGDAAPAAGDERRPIEEDATPRAIAASLVVRQASAAACRTVAARGHGGPDERSRRAGYANSDEAGDPPGLCYPSSDRGGIHNKTALGRSLRFCYAVVPSLDLLPGNKNGLPSVYNQAMDGAKDRDELLVFLHDDLHLVDFFWADELRKAIERFDIVGLVGNRRRAARQPSWVFVDERMTWDQPENLSGRIAHGNGFPAPVQPYGPAPQQCLLLDGLLLAVQSNTLHEHGLRFDERFHSISTIWISAARPSNRASAWAPGPLP